MGFAKTDHGLCSRVNSTAAEKTQMRIATAIGLCYLSICVYVSGAKAGLHNICAICLIYTYLFLIYKGLDFTNWRGITQLSIPGKVFCSVLLNRLREQVDSRLREEQSGFGKGRSCSEQIFTLMSIIFRTPPLRETITKPGLQRNELENQQQPVPNCSACFK